LFNSRLLNRVKLFLNTTKNDLFVEILQQMGYTNDSIQDFLQTIGENIRHYRKKKGFTLEALGEDIGLDKGNMHHIESGKNITLVTLLKIALFLDVSVTKLIPSSVEMSIEEAESMINRKKARRRKKAAVKPYKKAAAKKKKKK
jgi:transcriptional regulator with XRE-family HTH domain